MSNDIGLLCTAFPASVWTGAVAGMVCAVFGVFVILRRVVFVGIALSELAACGVAGALWAGASPVAGAALVTMGGAAFLALPAEERRVPRDAVLGALFIAAAGLSVLFAAGSPHGMEEVKSLLYGDLILARPADLWTVFLFLVPSVGVLLAFLRPILYVFVDRDMATVAGLRPKAWELLFFLLLGLVVAVSSKVCGALLVFCFLIVPSSLGLLLSRRLGVVLAIAAGSSLLCTLGGLVLSLSLDTPTNATLCVVFCAALSTVALFRLFRWNVFLKKRNTSDARTGSY